MEDKLKDEKYFKRFYYELLNVYGEITTDNEKYDAYNIRKEIYERFSYAERCTMLLNDYLFEISDYDNINHNRNWSIIPRYYAYVDKKYYEEKYNNYFNMFEQLKLKYLNNENLDWINYDIPDCNEMEEFKEKLDSLINESKEFAKNKMMGAIETYKYLDKKMYEFFSEWCKNHKYKDNNTYMKLIAIMKISESSFVKRIFEAERLKIVVDKRNEIKNKIGSFVNDEIKLIKGYRNKNK